MTDRPILFSGAMVRAILAGTKSQTRRIARIREWDEDRDADDWPLVPSRISGCLVRATCPYGVPGDRLWVRESFVQDYFDVQPGLSRHGYRADWTTAAADVAPEPRWTPSIHMPRWASRILLEVTAVRVERLQAITMDDAQAEGGSACGPMGDCTCDRDRFARLWDSLNAKRAPWSANPWVWVVSFRRVDAETLHRRAVR